MYKSMLMSRLFRGQLKRELLFCKHFSTSKFTHDLKWRRVPFNGISADLGVLPQGTSPKEFFSILQDSIETWKKDKKKAMWLHVPVDKSYLIPTAFKNGFEFHHAEKNFSKLYKWLPDKLECKVPVYATHHVGVSGLVLNEKTCEALVVQDRKKYKLGGKYKTFWKFPGGLSDEGENIGATAEREVFEETGIKSEFQALLLLRQQHKSKATFNKSDIYVVCRMKPLTHDIILCNDEIQDGCWMHLRDILRHPDTSPATKLGAKLALSGVQFGFQHFDITASQIRSLVEPSMMWCVYHRPLESVGLLSEQNEFTVEPSSSNNHPQEMAK